MKIKNIERRFLIQLVSVVIGLILWAIIIYIEDANFEATIKSIPIQISGESVLVENNLIVSNRNEIDEAVIAVRGKRSDIINSMGNVSAIVDVSKIEAPGRYNVKISYELATNAIYITQRRNSNVEIVVEKAETKEFDVEVIHQGTNPNSGIIVQSEAEKKKVSVKGTKADVANIKHIAAFVDISEMIADTVSNYPLSAVDEQYKEVKPVNEIYLEYDGLEITSTLHKKRTLPVEIEFPPELESKYAFEIESVSHSEIDVGVDTDVNITSLKAMLDYNEKTKAEEYVVPIEAPDGVYIPEKSKRVTVRLKVYPMAEQYVTVPLTVKAATGTSYTAPSEISFRVRGAQQYILAQNITAEADIMGYGPGTHTVEVNIQFSKTALYLTEKQYVSVTIQ